MTGYMRPDNAEWLCDGGIPGAFTLFDARACASIYADTSDERGMLRVARVLADDIERVGGIKPRLVDSLESLQDPSPELIVLGTEANPLIRLFVEQGMLDLSEIRGKWEATLVRVLECPLGLVQGLRDRARDSSGNPAAKVPFGEELQRIARSPEGRGLQKKTDPEPDTTAEPLCRVLVIAGSDRRGAFFGAYALSEQLGVSPWHWWSGSPVARRTSAHVGPGPFVIDEPAVRYRGIFLNDEYPTLTRWVAKNWGNVPESVDPPMPGGVALYGRGFYEHVFDLILRLRGNYLWPAMWNNAFNEDDPACPALADEYGIVMGTSHQEPMVRAQKEWDRRHEAQLGHWDWTRHEGVLTEFWRQGIRRNRDYDNLVTIGLRGADDTEMANGTPQECMRMLERIVEVQGRILAEECPRQDVPRIWCLYKEILDYYNEGLKVPDDVILLWGEDNWGNLRRVPTRAERARTGGAGIYYHFDYHGGPRSYQWINTTMLAKIQDQMGLAMQHGADKVWIVNVGHLKGYELATEFFMRMGWNPERWNGSNTGEFARLWAQREFGSAHAGAIGRILVEYSRLNARIKPELLAPGTWSVVHYGEAERNLADWAALEQEALAIGERLVEACGPEIHDSYYQTVLFPVTASALVNRLYDAAGRNQLYASQGRVSAARQESLTRELFARDLALMEHYNKTFAGGAWDHFMDQTHLGYVSWNDPEHNSLDAIGFGRVQPLAGPAWGVAVEGCADAWPVVDGAALTLGFDNYSRPERWVDLFCRGTEAVTVQFACSKPWIHVDAAGVTGARAVGAAGEVGAVGTCGAVQLDTAGDCRLRLQVDWDAVPVGDHGEWLVLIGPGQESRIPLRVFKPALPDRASVRGFVESDGCVAMDALHASRNTAVGECRWEELLDYGHAGNALRAWAPLDTPSFVPRADGSMNAPVLDFDMHLFSRGRGRLILMMAPTLNYQAGRGLCWAWSLDDGPVQVITAVPPEFSAQNGNKDWEQSVWYSMRLSSASIDIAAAGAHTLRIWMVDPGVVIQRVLVDMGGLKKSFMGPPESWRSV